MLLSRWLQRTHYKEEGCIALYNSELRLSNEYLQWGNLKIFMNAAGGCLRLILEHVRTNYIPEISLHGFSKYTFLIFEPAPEFFTYNLDKLVFLRQSEVLFSFVIGHGYDRRHMIFSGSTFTYGKFVTSEKVIECSCPDKLFEVPSAEEPDLRGM